ncbi:MAG: HAMP domain-containing histidine kinase, partial [Nitrososphaera sp.]|nr:HAMP domain-containing histidine kinase [Nitrososphaera sp.]
MESSGLQLDRVDTYTAAFASLVELDAEIGFTPDDGLTGQYRASAHAFEESVEVLHEDIEEEISETTSIYIGIILSLAGVIVAFNFGISTIILRQVSIIVQKVVEHDKAETAMRQKIEEANAALLKTEKAKDEFISMVSHELRTPIVPIKLYTDMMLKTKSLGELNEKQRKVLGSVQKGTDRLEMLIGDIFDVYKLDMGKLKFRMADTDIHSLVEQNSAELKSYTVEKKIKLVTELKTSGTIWCDPSRVGQVFLNLVKNSVDFVPNSGGEIIIRAEDGSDAQVVFTVQDNGPGITKGEEDGLFNKFYQTDTSATRKHGGSGLGLAICRG